MRTCLYCRQVRSIPLKNSLTWRWLFHFIWSKRQGLSFENKYFNIFPLSRNLYKAFHAMQSKTNLKLSERVDLKILFFMISKMLISKIFSKKYTAIVKGAVWPNGSFPFPIPPIPITKCKHCWILSFSAEKHLRHVTFLLSSSTWEGGHIDSLLSLTIQALTNLCKKSFRQIKWNHLKNGRTAWKTTNEQKAHYNNLPLPFI